MRRSILVPIALAAALLLLVVSSQIGVTADDWAKGLGNGLRGLREVGWPIVAAIACAQWYRTREPALGLYAMAISVVALTGVAPRLGWTWVGPWLHPLYPIGLALAAIAWAQGTPHILRGLRALPQVLLALTVAMVGLDWWFMLSAGSAGGLAHLGTLLNSIHVAYWAALTAVAWQGHRARRDRRLPWLAAQGAVLGLFNALSMAASLGQSPGLPGWFYPVLMTLPLAMAAGVLWSADPA